MAYRPVYSQSTEGTGGSSPEKDRTTAYFVAGVLALLSSLFALAVGTVVDYFAQTNYAWWEALGGGTIAFLVVLHFYYKDDRNYVYPRREY